MTTIKQIIQKSELGEKVKLSGWIVTKRDSGKIIFCEFRDGTDQIQLVVKKETMQDDFLKLSEASLQTGIVIEGIVKENFRNEIKLEIEVTNFKLYSSNTEEYPLGKKEHGVEFLMDNRHLWLRSKRQSAVMRLRHHLMMAVHTFFDQKGFYNISAPIITSNAAEDSTELFKFDYFGKDGFLTQSGQLHGEVLAMSLGRIYTFGPTFRAEKSRTRKHLTEFWMIEPEMAYYDHEMSLQLQEEFVKFLITYALKNCKRELEILERDTNKLETYLEPFARISYTDAIKLLQEKLNFPEIKFNDDFGSEHEKALSEYFKKPLFIINWPKAIKSFYMQPTEEDANLVKAADLIAPEGYGEIIGGSERIYDLEILKKSLAENNMQIEDYDWYSDLRKFGSVPHSGFGLGFERMIAFISGVEHIRETIPFPRLINRIKP